MAREFLQCTNETTWGVYNTSGTHTILQLTDSNQFTVRPGPMRWEIRSAGGYNRRVQTGSSKFAISGVLNNNIVYGSQAMFWATALGVTGTAPGPYDLPSYTIDHCIVMEDASNTKVYRRYLGCKFAQWQFSASSDTQLLRLNLNIIGGPYANITATDFPEPACSAYPYDPPFVLEHASTFLLGTTGSRMEFDRFQVTGANLVDATFFNQTHYTRVKYCGRNIDGAIVFPYVVTTDRSDFEAFSAHPASVTFTNGSHTLAFNFENATYTTAVNDQLDYNRVFLQGLTFADFFDSSVCNDFTLTAT